MKEKSKDTSDSSFWTFFFKKKTEFHSAEQILPAAAVLGSLAAPGRAPGGCSCSGRHFFPELTPALQSLFRFLLSVSFKAYSFSWRCSCSGVTRKGAVCLLFRGHGHGPRARWPRTLPAGTVPHTPGPGAFPSQPSLAIARAEEKP